MIYRAIVLYVVVQSVASTPPILQHSDPIVSPISGTHYRPKPASKHGGIPEVGKLPKTVSVKIPTIKFSTGNNHMSHNFGKDTYPTKPRNNHIRGEETHKQKTPISDEERAEKVNSDLEKMIQFITVLGQVDRYLSSRAKSIVSTLGRAMDNNNSDEHHIYTDKDTSIDY